MDYKEFKGTEFYKKTHVPEDFRYILYDADNPTLQPITRGNGADSSIDVEQFPVKEWGITFRREITEGGKTVTGTLSSFDIPEVRDLLPSTQDGPKRFIIEKVVADHVESRNAQGDLVPCDGVVVAVYTNVKISNIRDGQRESGINTLSLNWQSSKYYTGEQYAEKAGL